MFKSYFPKGVRVMEGGMDSGFNHVKPEEYRPRYNHPFYLKMHVCLAIIIIIITLHLSFTRLLQLKGRRHIRVTEVPLSFKSLNSGDVFILDAGVKIYQWNGSASSGMERSKAAQLSQSIEEERRGKASNSVCSVTNST
eukprot:TRINITY_DN9885_c0_g1_i1.p1 TRINITY_DN9885_c0_g1~~TRINITY_DN9885_c0_g1_i1.p1  ORF type:complete len:139 (-),score=39.88 TRINITY_DN9885_c0_g1_i1:619-1035(-)